MKWMEWRRFPPFYDRQIIVGHRGQQEVESISRYQAGLGSSYWSSDQCIASPGSRCMGLCPSWTTWKTHKQRLMSAQFTCLMSLKMLSLKAKLRQNTIVGLLLLMYNFVLFLHFILYCWIFIFVLFCLIFPAIVRCISGKICKSGMHISKAERKCQSFSRQMCCNMKYKNTRFWMVSSFFQKNLKYSLITKKQRTIFTPHLCTFIMIQICHYYYSVPRFLNKELL